MDHIKGVIKLCPISCRTLYHFFDFGQQVIFAIELRLNCKNNDNDLFQLLETFYGLFSGPAGPWHPGRHPQEPGGRPRAVGGWTRVRLITQRFRPPNVSWLGQSSGCSSGGRGF